MQLDGQDLPFKDMFLCHFRQKIFQLLLGLLCFRPVQFIETTQHTLQLDIWKSTLPAGLQDCNQEPLFGESSGTNRRRRHVSMVGCWIFSPSTLQNKTHWCCLLLPIMSLLFHTIATVKPCDIPSYTLCWSDPNMRAYCVYKRYKYMNMYIYIYT